MQTEVLHLTTRPVERNRLGVVGVFCTLYNTTRKKMAAWKGTIGCAILMSGTQHGMETSEMEIGEDSGCGVPEMDLEKSITIYGLSED